MKHSWMVWKIYKYFYNTYIMYNILCLVVKLLSVICLYTEHFQTRESVYWWGLCTNRFNLYVCLHLRRCKFVDCGSSVIISTSLRLGTLDLTQGKHPPTTPPSPPPQKKNKTTTMVYFMNRHNFSADRHILSSPFVPLFFKAHSWVSFQRRRSPAPARQ